MRNGKEDCLVGGGWGGRWGGGEWGRSKGGRTNFRHFVNFETFFLTSIDDKHERSCLSPLGSFSGWLFVCGVVGVSRVKYNSSQALTTQVKPM